MFVSRKSTGLRPLKLEVSILLLFGLLPVLIHSSFFFRLFLITFMISFVIIFFLTLHSSRILSMFHIFLAQRMDQFQDVIWRVENRFAWKSTADTISCQGSMNSKIANEKIRILSSAFYVGSVNTLNRKAYLQRPFVHAYEVRLNRCA